MTSLADRVFAGEMARRELENALEVAGVPCEKIGSDPYDSSLEIYDVEPGYRLTADAQRTIHAAGFAKVYLNHTDKWETHYTFKGEEFAAVNGWRVSYPHKRDGGEPGIWVESAVPSWPAKWFECGYAKIKAASRRLGEGWGGL